MCAQRLVACACLCACACAGVRACACATAKIHTQIHNKYKHTKHTHTQTQIRTSVFLGSGCGVAVSEWLTARAHGVAVSHPLRMRKALGSIPSVSICVQAQVFSVAASDRASKLEAHIFPFPPCAQSLVDSRLSSRAKELQTWCRGVDPEGKLTLSMCGETQALATLENRVSFLVARPQCSFSATRAKPRRQGKGAPNLVSAVGFEPTRSYLQWILSPPP